MEKNLYISSLLDVYGQILGEKQRRMLEQYYNEDLSLSEISENEGITRQGVRDLIQRAQQQLLLYEEKCGYEKAFRRLKALSAQVRDGQTEKAEELLHFIDSL